MKRVCLTTIIVVAAVALAGLARAQLFGPKMKKPGELIQKQAPMKVNQDLLKQATPENTRIVVSIPKQRAYLMIGEEIVADGPVSSGKRGHESPRGHMRVLEKDPNHHSTLYGDFVDGSGRIVRGGVSARIDSAPSGTHFAGPATPVVASAYVDPARFRAPAAIAPATCSLTAPCSFINFGSTPTMSILASFA